MKKIGALALAALLCLGMTACDGGESASGGSSSAPKEAGSLSSVELWGASGTEKVLRDVHGIYDSVKTAAKVDLTTARGEYEGAHLIMTAKEEVTYDAESFDLTAEDGTKFPASNVEIFVEKYVRVTANFENNNMPVGDYPDALVPIAAIKNAGENRISATDNQGLYVRVNVPVNQAAGKYTGKIKLTIGKESTEIPVTLTVVNAVVSETSHMRSVFLNQWSFEKGELDSSQEMYDKYTEALFEYRLNPDVIMLENDTSDEGIARFVEKAYQFMQNPKCANISLPYNTSWKGSEQNIDAAYFDRILDAFAKKSCQTNFDMFAKSVCYFGLIDEPQQNGILDRVKLVSTTFRKCVKNAADRLEADTTMTSSIKGEIVQSLRNLRNVVTSSYESAIADYVDTWCPQFQHYDSEDGRKDYDSQEEKWWYGCVSPRAPYPTYHTDDTLLSARVVSWMQAEYNIVGNLFWATDVYARYDGKKYVDIEDYYTGSASRFTNVNGDGYLFYPGKKYGIDGPVGSLRLEAIRDGIEEYELLYSLKNSYADISDSLDGAYTFDTTTLSKSLSEFIYAGSKVSATSETFAAARDSLLQLSVLNQSEAKLCLADYADDGYGTKTYRFVAVKDAALKNNGTAVSDVKQYGDYSLYSISTKLEGDSNKLDLGIEIGGKEYNYVQNLGGKATVLTAEDLTAKDFGKEGVTPNATLVEANTVSSDLTGKAMKTELPAVSGSGEQSFRLSGKYIEGVGKNTNRMILHIYYEGEDMPELIVSGKYSGTRIYGDIANVRLRKGMNEIVLSMGLKSWDKLGSLEYLAFILDNGEAARTLYFTDCIVYNN